MKTAPDRAPDGETLLIVMAKAPRPGHVKTRLARSLGAAGACRLYRAFLEDLAAALATSTWRTVWAVDPPDADLQSVIGAGCEIIPQRGRDLAERMYHCFQDLFVPGRRMVMIGADAPHIVPAAPAAAFRSLATHDVVLHPVADGGYCLIGLRQTHDLFRGIPMGTADVQRATLERAAQLGLTVAQLPATFDVDEPADLVALEREVRRSPAAYPATAAVLAGLARRRTA